MRADSSGGAARWLAKIDARDRAQAVTFAYQHGLTRCGTARLKVLT